jgi:hypothetical protein
MPIIAGRASAAYGAGFAAITAAPFAPSGAFDALASVTVPSGGVSSINFSSIPSDYKHLQIRAVMLSSIAGGTVNMTVNGTSTPYSRHRLVGAGGGGAPDAGNTTGSSNICIFGDFTGTGATPIAAGLIMDILDYTSTTKNKTMRIFTGVDRNGSGEVELLSAQWFPTTPVAITSLNFTIGGSVSSFSQHTQFSIYGVK